MQTIKKCSSVLALSVCVAALSLSQANAALKGTAGQVANSAKVGAKWCYNWGTSSSSTPSGVAFVPMWWSYYGASQAADNTAAAALKAKGATWLMTYNEPDHTDQANLTTAYALQGYKQAVKATTYAGLYVLSPACADDNSTWMQQFMAAVKSQGLRCDAVAVHNYNSSASSFLSYVDGIHSRYGYNLWITEFAPTDWKSPTAITTNMVATFMKTAIPGLKSRSYVYRYSWYCGTMPGTGVLGTAALFNSDGTLTACGSLYKTY